MIRTLLVTSKLVYPEPTFREAFSRWKYCARALARPVLTAQWFSFLKDPRLESLTVNHPYIFSKLQRPYLHRRLSAKGRLDKLKDHYQLLLGRLSGAELAQVVSDSGWEIASLPSPELQQFRLRLAYPRHSKEGELSLVLFDAKAGFPVAALTFSFMQLPIAGRCGIFVGGLQGNKAPNQKQLVIHLTRSLHGLRPKALLVFTLQRLARIWGISSIQAVAGREHIYCHYLKRRKFNANYDEFWRECQGRLGGDGNYELPLVATNRALSELSRNKRAVYRKRYQMLAELGGNIEQSLTRHSGGSFGAQILAGENSVACAR